MRMLKVPHFQVDDAIYADEVQQVRAFGRGNGCRTAAGQDRRARRGSLAVLRAHRGIPPASTLSRPASSSMPTASVCSSTTSREFGETPADRDRLRPRQCHPGRGRLPQEVRRRHPPDGGDPRRHSLTGIRGAVWRRLLRRPHRSTRRSATPTRAMPMPRPCGAAYVNAGAERHLRRLRASAASPWRTTAAAAVSASIPNKCHLFPIGVPGALPHGLCVRPTTSRPSTRPGQRLYRQAVGDAERQGRQSGVPDERARTTARVPACSIPGKRT